MQDIDKYMKGSKINDLANKTTIDYDQFIENQKQKRVQNYDNMVNQDNKNIQIDEDHYRDIQSKIRDINTR